MVGSNRAARHRRGHQHGRRCHLRLCDRGACAAVSASCSAAAIGSGDMELGTGYDYTAIAAVLVAAPPSGRLRLVVRTRSGVTVIAIIEVVLLLRGFSQQVQYLITGLIVLSVIMLHTIGERR
jgi:ribose/xylose/arabinose/galactoside ABC-type transport system permease subunit